MALGSKKPAKTIELLGCTVAELKAWLEARFYSHPETGERMSWKNYGRWHVDHKTPMARIDPEDQSSIRAICHYSNLQPLWAKENLMKGSR